MKIQNLFEANTKTTTPSKPRNFVAKNAMKTTSGAGKHKDKKKAAKQGEVKHKGKELAEGSDWGEPREILEDVLQTLEREVEWPLTEVMDPREVKQLLAPIVKSVNDKLLSMNEAHDDNWGGMSHKEFKRRELEHELGHEDEMTNYAVIIGNKKWKIFSSQRAAEKAAMTIKQKYGKDAYVISTFESPTS